MKIQPNLDFNKHPSDVANGTITDAINMMVDNESNIIKTECNIHKHDVKDVILNLYNSKHINNLNINILYAIPCNKEIIFFIQPKVNSTIDLVRYNEVSNEAKICCNIGEYHYGKFVGTFTYNGANELIISYSEYFDEVTEDTLVQPLKTINLGKFTDNVNIDINTLPLCPEIPLINVESNIIDGKSYKGWYFIFVRYKINDNDYTQWFDTYNSIFIDEYKNQYIENVLLSKERVANITGANSDWYGSNVLNTPYKSDSNHYDLGFVPVSDNNNVCTKSFEVAVNKLINFGNYNIFQLGFVCISKKYSKAFSSFDLNFSNNETFKFKFTNNSVKEINISDILKTYNNYYNVKTLTSCNNKLYASNYITNDINNDIITSLNIVIEGILIDNVISNSYPTTLFKNKNDEKTTPSDRISFDTDKNGTEIINDNNNNFVDVGLLPNSYYSFFIHFVDKYGNVTNGINLNKFKKGASIYVEGNISGKYINNLNNVIFKTANFDVSKKHLVVRIATPDFINISKLTNNKYIGAFISYEKFEPTIKFRGVCIAKHIGGDGDIKKGYFNFYSNELDYKDSIDLDVNKLIIKKCIRKKFNNKEQFFIFNTDGGKNNITGYVLNFDDNNSNSLISGAPTEYNIKNIEISNSNSLNNILNSSRLKCYFDYNKGDGTIKIFDESDQPGSNYYYIAELLTSKNPEEYYINENKTLIPCSNINTKFDFNVNTKNAFFTRISVIKWNDAIYSDNNFIFKKTNENGSFETTAPCRIFNYYTAMEYPMEVLQFKNKPKIIFFPKSGVNSETNKSYYGGCITECSDLKDLFELNQYAYYDAYPKTLDWYNPNIKHETNFTKTIRRSNTIQTESRVNAWRQFEAEQYKMIAENKGDVVKLVSIGNIFFAHTQHSLFMFDSTASLKTNDDNKLQLSNTDIWDLNYREVLTSQLGYGGIQHEDNGIVGPFGYIYYDSDSRKLYRFDDAKITTISDSIQYYLDWQEIDNITFVDDQKRNRVLLNCNGDIFSYNYKLGTFVSRHSYNYDLAYNTKNDIYLIKQVTNSPDLIATFRDKISHYGVYSEINNYECNPSISIIIKNPQSNLIHYIENIIYKLNNIKKRNILNNTNKFNISSPVEDVYDLYSGDYIRIVSNSQDTGVVDISTHPDDNINSVNNYLKPYYRFGHWHLNNIRNKISKYSPYDKNNKDDNLSKIYGDWFIVVFSFIPGQCVEIEDLTCVLKPSESLNI